MKSEKTSQCVTAELSIIAKLEAVKITCVILDYVLITDHSCLIMEILEIVIKVVSCMWAFKFIA